MTNPMHINANTYALASSATSAAVTLSEQDAQKASVVVTNPTAYGVFLVAGASAAPTAVFPTSATEGKAGVLVPSGVTMTVTKTAGHKYIAGISAGADSGKYIYLQVGSGE